MRTLYFVPCKRKDEDQTRIWSMVANSYSEAVRLVCKEHPVEQVIKVENRKFTYWIRIEEYEDAPDV